MSPTVFKYGKYRFFFFSREESRLHIHVTCPDGEAKFWLEPTISLASNYKLSAKAIKEVEEIISKHEAEIKRSWKKHFSS